MEKETIRRLLTIAVTALTAASLIFIGIGLFAGEENSRDLLIYCALFCTSLANLFGVIRNNNNDKE